MEIISWVLLQDYIRKAIPAVVPIRGTKGLSLVVGKNATSLSMRIPYAGEAGSLSSPYRELEYREVSIEGRPVLELSTSSEHLFRGFYLFAVLVAEYLEEQGEDVLAAIRRAQQTFGQLLMHRPLMSESQQVGLIGELALLRALVKARGLKGFASWLGPLGERHDFRLDRVEIEVKTTVANSRKHLINGLSQLEASPDNDLFVLSIQLELGGLGFSKTLSERITSVRNLLPRLTDERVSFEEYLSSLGYDDADADLYHQAYQLGSRPALVPVNDQFPKITSIQLESIIAEPLLPRIGDVHYEVNLDGLGQLEGSSPYLDILGNISPLE